MAGLGQARSSQRPSRDSEETSDQTPRAVRPLPTQRTQAASQSGSSLSATSQLPPSSQSSSLTTTSSARFNVRRNTKPSAPAQHPTSQPSAPVQDRHTFQLLQSIQTTLDEYKSTVAVLEQTVRELVASNNEMQQEISNRDSGDKDEAIARLEQVVREQGEALADLEEEVYSSEGGITGRATSDEKKAVTKFLKSAIEQLYGCHPPVAYPDDVSDAGWPQLTTADGVPTGPAMRWNFAVPLREEPNVSETRRLYTFIQEKGSSVALPNDLPRESIPAYATHTNIYAKAVSEIFKQYRATQANQHLKEWSKTGRVLAMTQIEEMQAKGDMLTHGERDALEQMQSHYQVMEMAMEKTESEVKNNARSRMNTVSYV